MLLWSNNPPRRPINNPEARAGGETIHHEHFLSPEWSTLGNKAFYEASLYGISTGDVVKHAENPRYPLQIIIFLGLCALFIDIMPAGVEPAYL
jgi:hypothetical protein